MKRGKTIYILEIKANTLRVGFDTLERAQAFMTVVDGGVKKAGSLYMPEMNIDEYPADEDKDDA